MSAKPRLIFKPLFSQSGVAVCDCAVFFDFDNTITLFDVLDEVIKKFAVDGDWAVFEDAWRRGRIGSRECLEGQLRSVRVTKDRLLKYLRGVEVDPYFHKLLCMLKEQGVEPVILSDSFSFMIDTVMRNNGIKRMKIYANSMRFYKDKIIPAFPYTNRLCSKCANCKKAHIAPNNPQNKTVVYIGDGLSDVCPASVSGLVFAKQNLAAYLKKADLPSVEIKDLSEIYKHFREEK